MGIEEVGRQSKKEMDADQRKMVQQKNRQGVRNLNMFWMHEMVNTSAQLREKMAFFLAWAFCLSQPECFLPTGFARRDQEKCAWKFRNPT